MYIPPRSVAHKVFDAWRSPNRFTKNPDIIRLASGRLLLVYSDTEAHWGETTQILTILYSDDEGRSWDKLNEVATADRSKGDEHLVTPRISLLSDNRIAVICDHDDYSHFHEDQPPGNWIWWSTDEGNTWDGPHKPNIMGFEPDRMMDLPDGRLAVCSQIMLRESQEFAEIMTTSSDGGITWGNQVIVAHDGYHRFCEGALVILNGGKELACVMRENQSGGIPSFVTFSQDNGKTWSDPKMCPFALHRPYAKQLADGRCMVTGRHVNGGLGCYAWIGDLKQEAGTYAIGGPRRKYNAMLKDGSLIIENKPEHECRYSLLPPQNRFSTVDFEAEIKVEGPPGKPISFMSCGSVGALLTIGSDFISLGEAQRTDLHKKADFSRPRKVAMRHSDGLLRIQLDGEDLIYRNVFRGETNISDFQTARPDMRTMFGQWSDSGKSSWRAVSFSSKNRTLEDWSWNWSASSGDYPDQYQRNRLVQIHGNHPDQKPHPDHGYSSWLTLPDGRIIFIDYTNCGDIPGQSHIVGVYLNPEDIAL